MLAGVALLPMPPRKLTSFVSEAAPSDTRPQRLAQRVAGASFVMLNRFPFSFHALLLKLDE
jgi:hypothetical protein